MCKCSYTTKEDPNRPVVISTASSQGEPSNRASSSPGSQREFRTTALNSSKRDDGSKRYESTPSPLKALQVKKGKLKRRVTIGSALSRSSSSTDNCVDETEWPPFADEDYIVFCFEEDGEFHVVMEENSPRPVNRKLQDEEDVEVPTACACKDEIKDGNLLHLTSRQDNFLPNKEIEDSLQFSPKFNSDGMAYHDQPEENIECHTSSMECRNGSVESVESVESSSSSQSECKQELTYETDPEIECIRWHVHILGKDSKTASPAYRRDCFLPNQMAEDEESIYLSPRSQNGGIGEADPFNDDEALATESEFDTGGNQLEEIEEAALESVKSANSSPSHSSSSSFSFPVLQWECASSPVAWPRSQSLRLTKHRSRLVCLRCCRFWY
ncbi:hypothetical protein Ancab_036086 [Ancistrocladus abbreviatus]